MGHQTLLVDRADGVVTATLNRPHRKNACTVGMFDELFDLAREVRDTRADRVLVLTGAGDAFCSGMDLGELPTDGTDTVQRASAAVLALKALPKPTLAAVNGVTAGVGVGIALSCDLVLAAESSRFIMSFVKRGLTPDGGTSWLLPHLVGPRAAKEIAFFGDPVSSARALELGLVNRVLPDAELAGEVATWVAKLASGPPIALANTKALIDDAASLTFAQAVDGESVTQKLSARTKDFREALSAFREKREPTFTGD